MQTILLPQLISSESMKTSGGTIHTAQRSTTAELFSVELINLRECVGVIVYKKFIFFIHYRK